jgi:hypothetical protein
MVQASTSYKNAVVIGGGLLGLEAANGLMKRGMNVTVVHLLDTLMERQLDQVAGGLLRKSLEERGMVFKMPAQTEAILGEDRVTGVRFADGEEIPADLVVMAVGIRPNIELARKAGLHCERGIVVSDTMQTYDGRIYAVGECVQHRRQTYGLVAPLFDQAKVCANHLAMKGFATYDGSVVSTKLKVTGSTCSPPATSRRVRTRKRSSCRTLPAASTSGSSCATRRSSAPCSMAIPSTAHGTSSICATAPTFRKCASGWCSAPPISAMAAIAARTRSPP